MIEEGRMFTVRLFPRNFSSNVLLGNDDAASLEFPIDLDHNVPWCHESLDL